MGRKKKLPLFADDTINYVENPEESIKKEIPGTNNKQLLKGCGIQGQHKNVKCFPIYQ